MELFWKNGYHATSIQELVNHLGINRASIYDTYGGKKELFDKAFALYRQVNTNEVALFLDKHENVKEGFRALFEMAIRESLSDVDRKGCFVVNTATELIPGDGSIKEVIKENQEVVESSFYDFLLRGQKNGEIAAGKDLKAIAGMIFTLYSGLRVIAKVQSDPEKLLASVDTALMVLD